MPQFSVLSSLLRGCVHNLPGKSIGLATLSLRLMRPLLLCPPPGAGPEENFPPQEPPPGIGKELIWASRSQPPPIHPEAALKCTNV